MHSTFGNLCKLPIHSSVASEQASFFHLGPRNTTLLGNTLNRESQCTVCGRVNDSSIKIFNNLLLYYLLHRKIQSSLMLDTRLMIRHELNFVRTNTGGISIISWVVHPVSRLNIFSTTTKHSTCLPLWYATVMTGSVLFIQKNTYLTCSGKALSYNVAASSIDSLASGDLWFFLSNSYLFIFYRYSNRYNAATHSS